MENRLWQVHNLFYWPERELWYNYNVVNRDE
jgi:hypothetical protein